MLFKEPKNHRYLKVHTLHGRLAGRYRFSVTYRFRIVFSYRSEKEAIFLAIGDHAVFRDQVRHHHSAVFIAAQNEDGTLSDAAATVEQETRKHINAFLDRSGAGMIQVDNIALGRANPPEGVRRTIEATAQQAQEVKTQAERTRAANARESAERATAAADMAYLNAVGISTDQFVELQRLKVWGEVCKTNTCIFAPGNVPIALSASGQGATAAPSKTATVAK